MKKTMLGVLCALFAVTAMAQTNLAPSKWAVTLGGVGLTAGQNIFNDWQWGGEIGLSRRIDLTLFKQPVRTDLGFRQTMAYGTIGYQEGTKTEDFFGPCTTGPTTVTTTTQEKISGWTFRSEVFYDFNFPIYKRLSGFAGPNFAVLYGGDSEASVSFGPEVGFKLDLGKKWNLFTRANYDWNLSQANSGFRVSSGVGREF